MKIIGWGHNYGYIVEMSNEDICAIVGEYRAPSHNRFQVGTTVEIGKTWAAIGAARTSQGAVEKAAKLLHAQADALSSLLRPIVDEHLPQELKPDEVAAP